MDDRLFFILFLCFDIGLAFVNSNMTIEHVCLKVTFTENSKSRRLNSGKDLCVSVDYDEKAVTKQKIEMSKITTCDDKIMYLCKFFD